ncbi:SepM family pheromone-processing serine protease [Bacillus xiapuensis]|uniref:SepM family pheromone-processing serine protease n=1 Tax=Bacillus xiapuensis TaxID=2014075 RepID=UPI000C24351E|nr:SepM family pheromone-processing serine protease [Bacillus xiapuensis]
MRSKLTVFSYLFLFMLIAASFIQLPYYVMKPGEAHELAPIVSVAGGNKEKGELMLTTIKMGQATPVSYAVASIRDYEEIIPVGEVRAPHESEEEYNIRQKYLMDNSQHSAIQVAFDAAKKPYKFINKGVYVLSVFPNMPAQGVIKAGDQLIAADDKKMKTSKQFTKYIHSKRPGDEIRLTYVRDQVKKRIKLPLKSFSKGSGKAGIGITLLDRRKLVSDPKVQLKAEAIGGPSAGLMFSLEIYNQLVKEDVTKGRKIAGTGTIQPDGTVGRIGGIAQKVVAADKAGAEIFFAPNDAISPEMKKEWPSIRPNYQEAKAAAEDIQSDMKIVPVQSFHDALDYLAEQ